MPNNSAKFKTELQNKTFSVLIGGIFLYNTKAEHLARQCHFFAGKVINVYFGISTKIKCYLNFKNSI